ncbi:protease HtpX [Natronospirillum operosum]|uniref:Protease HtpX n=1 Tax=Natronospirillum operosum TaxID=2759953 RepID=A0A4Z0WG29_9GAMM|nr:protease HtpX [Natronospirillum operosum]TGG94131.1 protease HtpX [Natronospirillum operosum]
MRIMLFILTNIGIIVTFGIFTNIVLPLFGVRLEGTGLLLVFAAMFGMGGSFISLLLSKKMAIKATGARVIEQPRTADEQWLMQTVARLAKEANIGMPSVAVYGGQEINAFATGAKRDDALVAVSAGLLQNMQRDEQEAVLAHEVAHIANGDMVTLTLIQGVVNTFVIFFARIVANLVSNALGGRNGQGLGFFGYIAVVMVLEVIFGLLASVVVHWFSRKREYAADAGSARLVGKDKMIAALQRLKGSKETELEGNLVAFGILGKGRELLATHPSLDDRIAALQRL